MTSVWLMNELTDSQCCCRRHVSSQLYTMAYQAGIQAEPSALVNNISSNIQKLTLLSNA